MEDRRPYTRKELERVEASGNTWPTRGSKCPRCGARIPEFAELSAAREAELVALARSDRTAAMDALRSETGCPARFAKIWALHPDGPVPRPPVTAASSSVVDLGTCPSCGAPLGNGATRCWESGCGFELPAGSVAAGRSFRIEFSLLELDAVEPWPDEDGPRLSWFGLSDGSFGVSVGGSSLFSLAGEDADADPTLDYQVAPLFDDLCGVLAGLSSEPDEALAARLSPWPGPEMDDDLRTWLQQRMLDFSYYEGAPRVAFWRQGDTVHAQAMAGRPPYTWPDRVGHARIPLATFIREARQFGERFLSAMDDRVQKIEAGWRRDGVRLDPYHLRADHRRRAEEWAAAVAAATAGG